MDASITFADFSDFVVAVGCVSGLIFLGGFSFSEYRHEMRAKACPTHLPDGRRLMTFHLTKNGPDKCVFEAPPTPAKWKKT